MEKLTDHEQKLQTTYAAIADLRKKKEPITISAVWKKAGIARGTIYSKHPDWTELREVIKGKKPSPWVNLAEVEHTESQKWERQLGQLQKKVKDLSLAVQDARKLVDNVYDKLLKEVHKHFILAKETPKERSVKSGLAEDNVKLQGRLENALAEVRQLRAERGLEGKVVGFAPKKIIDVYPAEKRSALQKRDLNSYCQDAMNTLDPFFKEPTFAPTLVYLMCGQFAAGKSRWIKNHKPMNQGLVLYIDGTNHTADMRSLFIKRIRTLSQTCRVVCCRVFANVDDCLDRNRDATRQRMKMAVPEALIRIVEAEFEEVTYDEGLDAIELFGSHK